MPCFLKLLNQSSLGYWKGPICESLLGFHYDTRLLTAGDCFLALKTEHQDGHIYLSEALKKGAHAAIVTHYHPEVALPQWVVPDVLMAFQSLAKTYRNTLTTKIIGLTGSCGKTSTKDLLHHLLGEGNTFKTPGNLNNTLGVPYSLFKIDDHQHDYAVIEAGINQPGEMQCLADMIQPDIACLTTIAPVHLEKLMTLEGVANEKSLLLKAVKQNGAVFFPHNCLQYESISTLQTPCHVLCQSDALIQAATPLVNPLTWSFISKKPRIHVQLFKNRFGLEGICDFILPPMSPGMIDNTLLAVAIAAYLGIDYEKVKKRLASWNPSERRGQVIQRPDQWIYVDCYNANPISMQDAMTAFCDQAPANQPRLYVLGGMNELGLHAGDYHEALGQEIPLNKEDTVCLVGPYAEAVKKGLLASGAHPDQIHLFSNTHKIQRYFNVFKGAIFLKGSHSFQLWQLLDNHEGCNI